jgi:hypothetical protein
MTQLPAGTLAEIPRWKATLWVYLGTHFVDLAQTNSLGMVTREVSLVSALDLPQYIHLVPALAVGVASAYTCYRLGASRIRHNVENALHVSVGYLAIGLTSILVTGMRPNASTVLLIGAFIFGALWLGSNLVNTATGGFPIIGITSLGTLVLIGLLVLVGGAAILTAIWGLVVVAVTPAVLAGTAVGASRRLENIGRRNQSLPRLHGLKILVQKYWIGILASLVVGVMLIIGLTA